MWRGEHHTSPGVSNTDTTPYWSISASKPIILDQYYHTIIKSLQKNPYFVSSSWIVTGTINTDTHVHKNIEYVPQGHFIRYINHFAAKYTLKRLKHWIFNAKHLQHVDLCNVLIRSLFHRLYIHLTFLFEEW